MFLLTYHGDTAGSNAVLQIQGQWFKPKLDFLSVWQLACLFWVCVSSRFFRWFLFFTKKCVIWQKRLDPMSHYRASRPSSPSPKVLREWGGKGDACVICVCFCFAQLTKKRDLFGWTFVCLHCLSHSLNWYLKWNNWASEKRNWHTYQQDSTETAPGLQVAGGSIVAENRTARAGDDYKCPARRKTGETWARPTELHALSLPMLHIGEARGAGTPHFPLGCLGVTAAACRSDCHAFPDSSVEYSLSIPMSPDPTKQFKVHTDASEVGIDALLSQATVQGTMCCAAAMSKDMAGSEYIHNVSKAGWGWCTSWQENQWGATAQQKRVDNACSQGCKFIPLSI